MSIIQYTFQVLTKESFEAGINDIKSFMPDNYFNEEAFWIYKKVNKSFFEEMGFLLKKSKSWSPKIDLYGDQESNCLEVLFDWENFVVKSVSLRIDFTTKYEPLLRCIIDFFILKGLVVLDEQLNFVPLNYETIKRVIEEAPQLKRYNLLREKKG
jgi:hypothetical protein